MRPFISMSPDPPNQTVDSSLENAHLSWKCSRFAEPLQHVIPLRREALLSNALFLAINTGTMGIFGFLFWVLAAHLFPTKDVGVAATLITAAGLISFVSQCGFNSSLVAFLPTSQEPSAIINSGLRIGFGASVVVAGVYVGIAPHFARPLSVLWQPWFAVVFILLTPMVTLNALTDSVFVAFRSAKYNALIDGVIQGAAKLALLGAMIALGSIGIFLSFGVGAAIAVAGSLIIMTWRFGYRAGVRRPSMSQTGFARYSGVSYVASVVNYLPTFVLPLLIVRGLGAPAAAYFYTALQIAALLYGIVNALAISLFAEGSQPRVDLSGLIRRTSFALTSSLVPAVAIVALASSPILFVFGQRYEEHARTLLIVLALSALPLTLNVLTSTLLRIRLQFTALIATNAIFALTACGLSALWMHRPLWWTGLALLLGDGLSGIAGVVALILANRQRGHSAGNPTRHSSLARGS
jgi:O-antigen/teichoic acid export membrane protein